MSKTTDNGLKRAEKVSF